MNMRPIDKLNAWKTSVLSNLAEKDATIAQLRQERDEAIAAKDASTSKQNITALRQTLNETVVERNQLETENQELKARIKEVEAENEAMAGIADELVASDPEAQVNLMEGAMSVPSLGEEVAEALIVAKQEMDDSTGVTEGPPLPGDPQPQGDRPGSNPPTAAAPPPAEDSGMSEGVEVVGAPEDADAPGE